MEPTRSVTYRSAATLALDVGDHELAMKLCLQALENDPPEQIGIEIENVLAKAKENT